MRNWMRDRLMRRKKKDGDAEKASSEQPKQAPLQPDFYEAQGNSEAREDAQPGNLHHDAQDGGQDNGGQDAGQDNAREAAPSRPLPPSLPPIDDDNRWNRIDADPPPARAPFQRSASTDPLADPRSDQLLPALRPLWPLRRLRKA